MSAPFGRLALALVLLTPLAGCTEPPAAAPHDSGIATEEKTQVPIFKVGDWWRYRTSAGKTVHYVVSGETAADYILDTDEEGLALFDAHTDVSTLGPIRKSDLAGSQGADRVEFFKWPMQNGQTWTTTWDGIDVTLSVHATQTEAHFTATRSNGTLFATYTYRYETRWITALAFMDAAGQNQFSMELEASGTGFSESLVRWRILDARSGGGDGPVGQSSFQFAVPPEATDLILDYSASCNPGVYALSMGPIDSPGQGRGALDHGPCDGGHQVRLPAMSGNWGFLFSCTGGSCHSTYALFLLEKSLFQVDPIA